MNKWVIFIIIVAAVSVVGVGANLFTDNVRLYEVDLSTTESGTKQESDPIIRFVNISDEHLHVVTRGVLVIHNDNFSMNFLGTQPPEAYKSFTESGDPSAVIALLAETPNISGIFEINAIESGRVREITIPRVALKSEIGDIDTDAVRISYMAPIMDKITETSVGMVWLNGYALYDTEGNQAQENRILTEVIEIDINNNKPVQHHPEFYTDEAASGGVVQITVDT